MKKRWVGAIVGVFTLLLCGALPSHASSGIQWSKGYVEAEGFGAPPEGVYGARAKILARRAAQGDAYRQLVEIVQGVHVTSETTVQNFVVASDTIQTKVQGFLQGAQIVVEEPTPEGGFHMVMRLPLHGPESLNSILLKEARKKEKATLQKEGKPLPTPLPIPQKLEPDPKAYEATYAARGDYTGLIVDARGLGLQPAMSPKILTESGDVIYGILKIEGDALAELVNEKGIVGYAQKMEAAKTDWRAGSHPLIVKGITLSGHFKADVTISDADGQKILKENEKSQFLQHLRVIFLY